MQCAQPDVSGRFFYHPLLPLPQEPNDPTINVEFSTLEPEPLIGTHVRNRMLRFVRKLAVASESEIYTFPNGEHFKTYLLLDLILFGEPAKTCRQYNRTHVLTQCE